MQRTSWSLKKNNSFLKKRELFRHFVYSNSNNCFEILFLKSEKGVGSERKGRRRKEKEIQNKEEE